MLLGYSLILLSSLLYTTHSYYDLLTHTAVDKIPATTGHNVELRCTKIIEKSADDYVEASSCDPTYEKHCYHQWSFKGKKIGNDTHDDKYKTSKVITQDYCENFAWTTDTIRNSFNFLKEVNNSEWYGSNMRCLASILTIKDVKTSDFGLYSCNFSDHDPEKKFYGGYYDRSELQNITLYDDADSTQTQATKVEYFETFYTKGIKSKLLMQCVGTGGKEGKLYWFVQVESKDCPKWSDPKYNSCANNSIINIEDLNSKDFYRCYNFTVASHTPHHPDITESFIFFENICGSDWGSIFCSPDAQGKVRPSQWGYITEKDEWDDYYRHYYYKEEIAATLSVFAFILIGLLFLAAGIVACIRSGVSNCCKNNYSRVPQVMSAQGPPMVMTYRVAPVQGLQQHQPLQQQVPQLQVLPQQVFQQQVLPNQVPQPV